MDLTKFIGAYSPVIQSKDRDALAVLVMDALEHGMRDQETVVRQISSMTTPGRREAK